jgi:hypothetical protein
MFKSTMREAIKLPRRMLRIFVSLSLRIDFSDVKAGGPQGSITTCDVNAALILLFRREANEYRLKSGAANVG